MLWSKTPIRYSLTTCKSILFFALSFTVCFIMEDRAWICLDATKGNTILACWGSLGIINPFLFCLWALTNLRSTFFPCKNVGLSILCNNRDSPFLPANFFYCPIWRNSSGLSESTFLNWVSFCVNFLDIVFSWFKWFVWSTVLLAVDFFGNFYFFSKPFPKSVSLPSFHIILLLTLLLLK